MSLDIKIIDKPEDEGDRQFLHTLPVCRGTFSSMDTYEVNGVAWYGSAFIEFDNISLHPGENVILNVFKPKADHFSWTYSLKITEGVYVRHGDVAPTLESACTAAMLYRPTEIPFDFHGSTSLWYETEAGRLYAAIDGDEAQVVQIDENRFRYYRSCAAAKPVLDMVDTFMHQLAGYEATQRAAVIACLDAPEKFKLACAAMVGDFVQPVAA